MPVIVAAFPGIPVAGRDQGIVKMDHDILGLLTLLQRGNVDCVDSFSAVDGEYGCVAGGLSADDRRRNYAENIPRVAVAGSAASGGDQIVIAGTDQNAVRHFIQEIATFKVTDRGGIGG